MFTLSSAIMRTVISITADGQITVIVGVHPVPALRTELPPLRHHGVEVAVPRDQVIFIVS